MLAATAMAGQSAGHGRWTMQDLGGIVPLAINDRGELLAETAQGPVLFGYLWRNGKAIRLKYRNRPVIFSAGAGAGAQLNIEGDIIGYTRPDIGVLLRKGRLVPLRDASGRPLKPVAINDRGHILAIARSSDRLPVPVLWRDGQVDILGSLGGITSAAAINNRDQIVGSSETPDGVTRAFMWEQGQMVDLDAPADSSSAATLINDVGEIVGARIDAQTGESLEVLAWKDGQMSNLGSFGHVSARAIAINASGHILVQAAGKRASRSQYHGFLVHDGAVTEIKGPLDGGNVFVVGLNDDDQVVGRSQSNRRSRSFVWHNGVAVALPGDSGRPPSGWPTGLNENNQIIGAIYVNKGRVSQLHGALWTFRN